MEFSSEKQKAAFYSIASNTVLICLKLAAGIITNSISIISEAIHSLTDLLASLIAYFSVKKASYPPDYKHQFGHGKYEDLSGFIEGLLILFAAGYIIFESFEKILENKYSHIDTTAGIIVMAVSILVNIAVSRNLFRVALKTDSIALFADAEHLRTDVLTSAGVLTGLILIKITNINILDPIVAVIIALVIIKAGLHLCFTSIKNLLDTSLPESDQKIITEALNKYISDRILEIKNLKSRKAGSEKLIEMVIVIPKKLTIESGHDLCDKIEEDLENKIKNTRITIHIEPCKCTCGDCKFCSKCYQK